MSFVDFFKYLNENCKLSMEEDNLVYDINQIISENCLKYKKDSFDSFSNLTSIADDIQVEQEPVNKAKSEIIEKLDKAIDEVKTTKKFLLETKNEIEISFSKLNLILESRDDLSSTLKEFNNSSKKIMLEKEK